MSETNTIGYYSPGAKALQAAPLMSLHHTTTGYVYVLKMLLEKYVDRLQEGAGCEYRIPQALEGRGGVCDRASNAS